MTADIDEPDLGERPEIPLPAIDSISTYAPGASSQLCLATTWLDDDPMPTTCARAVHVGDPRHVAKPHALNDPRITWEDE